MILKILITLLLSVKSSIDWEAAETLKNMIMDSQLSIAGATHEHDQAILQWLKARFPKSFVNIQMAPKAGSSKLGLLGESVEASKRLDLIPQLLRLLFDMHSVGLRVPWTRMRHMPRSPHKFALVSPVAWEMVADPHTMTVIEGTREDVSVLVAFIRSWGIDLLYPDSIALVAQIEKEAESSVIDFDTWTYRFTKLGLVSVPDLVSMLHSGRIDKAVFCGVIKDNGELLAETAFRARSRKMEVGDIWRVMHGELVVELVSKEWSICPEDMINFLISFLARATKGSSTWAASLFLLQTLKEWSLPGGMCASAPETLEKYFLVVSLPFIEMVCPMEFVFGANGVDIDELFTHDRYYRDPALWLTTAKLWSTFDLASRLDEDLTEDEKSRIWQFASRFVSFMIRGPEAVEAAATHFPSFYRFCQDISITPFTLNLAWVCFPNDSVEKACEAIERLDEVASFVPAEEYRQFAYWDAEGFGDMVSVIQDPGSTEVCRDRLLHITTRRLSQSLLSLNGFEEVRSAPAVKALCGWKGHSEPVADLAVAWLCGAGTDRLCSILATAEDPEMAVRDMASRLFYDNPDPDMWETELSESRIYDSVSNAREACANRALDFLVEVVGSEDAPSISSRHHIPGQRSFCLNRRSLFLGMERPIAEKVCPILFVPRLPVSEVRRQVREKGPKSQPGSLVVTRDSAFSDSLPLLLSQFASASQPNGIRFEGERGIDQGGLTRDWFARLGGIAAGTCDTDPLGGLFKLKKKPGSDGYLIINPERLGEHDMDYWYAFGRLMALAVLKKEQLGISLPVMFFARFLNGMITAEDLVPEEEDLVKALSLSELKYGISDSNPDGFTMTLYLDELPDDIDGTDVSYATQNQVLARVLAFYNQPSEEAAFDKMRSGFAKLLSLRSTKEIFNARQLKILIAGDDVLDVAALKASAIMRDPPATQLAFDLVFEWLAKQNVMMQKKFLQFVTGSSSLSVRTLEFSLLATQSKYPSAHTCMNLIELPDYQTLEEIEEHFPIALRTERIDNH